MEEPEDREVKVQPRAPKIPDFESFKKEMESTDIEFNPFKNTTVKAPSPNVEEDDKSISSYCLKCVNDKTIRWCNNCGQAFKSSNSQRKYCQHCS